jgi:amino acid permease
MASHLFISSGTALYESGPVSLLLAYLLMGSVAFAMLVSAFVQPGVDRVDVTW